MIRDQAELCVFCAVPFGATHFYFPEKCVVRIKMKERIEGMEESKKEKRKVEVFDVVFWGVIIALVFLLASCVNGGSSSSGSSNSRTCKSCGRTFTDSTNKSSIARTGMCSNCYNNFKWGQAATGRGTAYHHDCEEDECETLVLSFSENTSDIYYYIETRNSEIA